MRLWIEVHCSNPKCDQANYEHDYPMEMFSHMPTRAMLSQLAKDKGWLKVGTDYYCSARCANR